MDGLSWKLIVSTGDSISASILSDTLDGENMFGLASSMFDSSSAFILWTNSISTGGAVPLAAVLFSKEEGSEWDEAIPVIIPALKDEEYGLEDISTGLLCAALSLAVVFLGGCPSIFAFKLCHHDVTVEGGLALLDEDTPTKGFLLCWQRSHRFQSPRASEDLRTYSTNRYTPRKAVIRVKIHSAG